MFLNKSELSVTNVKELLLAACLLILQLPQVAHACTPIPQNKALARLNSVVPVVTTSPNQRFFVKLMPARWAREKGTIVKKREAYAIAYDVKKNGHLQQIWSMKTPEYTNLYLSDNGRILTTVKSLVSGETDKTALNIFYNGKKIRSYSPHNLGARNLRRAPCGGFGWGSVSQTGMINPLPRIVYRVPLEIKVNTGRKWVIDLDKGYLR